MPSDLAEISEDDLVPESMLAYDLGVTREELKALRKSGEAKEDVHWAKHRNTIFWFPDGLLLTKRLFNLEPGEPIAQSPVAKPRTFPATVLRTYRNRRLLDAKLPDQTEIRVVVADNLFYGTGDTFQVKEEVGGGKWVESTRPRPGRGRRRLLLK